MLEPNEKVSIGDYHYPVMLIPHGYGLQNRLYLVPVAGHLLALHTPGAGSAEVKISDLIEKAKRDGLPKIMDWDGAVVIADYLSTPEEIAAMRDQCITSAETAVRQFFEQRATQILVSAAELKTGVIGSATAAQLERRAAADVLKRGGVA